jgi:hypothetical protein
VEPSLLEAAADGDEPIAARLGPPADFAADLRASAGLPAAARGPAPRNGLRASLSQLAAAPWMRRAGGVLRELAPVWWAARAYLAVGLLAIVAGVDWSVQYAVFPRFGSAVGTTFVLALALAGSFALGLRSRHAAGGRRRAAIALNALLVLAAVPVLARAADAPYVAPPSEPSAPAELAGVVLDGVVVENIYPYDRNGRLLQDVRLYDNLGLPLSILHGIDDPNRRPVYERGGARAFNAFPIRHFEPGTRRVARPNAGPGVDPQRLRTPPLRRR